LLRDANDEVDELLEALMAAIWILPRSISNDNLAEE
jgi:hypothetical protein